MAEDQNSAPEAPASAALSVDQAISLLGKVGSEPGEARADGGAGGKEIPPASAQAEEPSHQDNPEGQQDGPQDAAADQAQQPAATIQPKPPASWTKEEQAEFSKLPPALQDVISRREADRETFANAKAQEAAKAREEITQHLSWAQQELGKQLSMAAAAIEGEFAGIDWNKLQMTDPQAFLQLDAMRKERLAKLQEPIAMHQQLSQKAQQEQAAKHQEHLKTELKAVTEFLRAEVPDFKPAEFTDQIKKYLTTEGVPEAILPNMANAWELKIATKAMLYDQMKASRDAAASKVAGAPRVMGTQGKSPQGTDSGSRYKAAIGRLEKSGTVDDAVAALRALRGA